MYPPLLFATLPKSEKEGVCIVLLAFSPFEDDSRLNSDEHIAIFHFIARVMRKYVEYTVDIIGDNATTNKCIPTKINLLPVACCSHRLNLSVSDNLKRY